MSKKYIVITIFALVLLVSIVGILVPKKLFTPKKIHYHAGFIVFQNNKKLDFSESRYMYIEPCSANGGNKKEDDATLQIEKAHLHDNVGDLVHIERSGAIWRDLFTNIQFPIDYAKTTGFINGKQITNFQTQPIRPYDSLVVFIGNNDKNFLSQAVTKEYIQAQAKKSITCGE